MKTKINKWNILKPYVDVMNIMIASLHIGNSKSVTIK